MSTNLTLLLLGAMSALPLRAQEAPTFAKDVAPIIWNHCTNCHRPGRLGPMPFTNYEEVKAYGAMIQYTTERRLMPPWRPDPHYTRLAFERVLTPVQIETIKKWYEAGMPEGNAAETPPLPDFPEGSVLGEGDTTLVLPAFTITENIDIYQNFVIKNPFGSGKYLKAVEILPGNDEVVHHVVVYIETRGRATPKDEQTPEPGYRSEGFGIDVDFIVENGRLVTPYTLMVWTPGDNPIVLPHNLAYFIPDGAEIVVQMHYSPNSVGKTDQTRVRLHYYKENRPPREVRIDPFINWFVNMTPPVLSIPPYSTPTFYNHQRIDDKLTILGFMPHMHLIGKSMTVFLEKNQAGARDTTPLVRINDWNFNWQGFYLARKPIVVEPGTYIKSISTFDNTPNNPLNPSNPPIQVNAGESTLDEMIVCYVMYCPYEEGDENLVIDASEPVDLTSRAEAQDGSRPRLLPPFPNPTEGKTTFRFLLNRPAFVVLTVLDAQGREVAFPVPERQFSPGEHEVVADLSRLPTGTYWCRIRADGVESRHSFKIVKNR
ncbi:MAG: T9SS type A sorting domain-containing protein [Bacteroidia bacterium]|nr:T9SS type A sorting domain-containing protein [Bacteroidia bacterium]